MQEGFAPQLERPTSFETDPPVHYQIDCEKKRVSAKFGIKVTINDIVGYTHLLRSDPRFQADFSELVDLREVEILDLQAEDFMTLADDADPFSPGARRAFVVKNSVQEHAIRMHRVLRTQANIRTFQSLKEAEAWISGK
ncbi:MAG TPA: hypothetical protein VMX38_23450 [Verrucomicrobiae bacterium]|jgi:hypothetical protein|nr:hypothetical protein [Verrucomicrobiae bacterium]